MTLRIKNWADNFEKADSKRCKEMKWVAVPTKMDSKQFRKLARKPGGIEVFGIWILLVELAAKMPERGVLKDKDGDLTLEDMELMTGFPAKQFRNAISVLCSDEIGWLTDDKQMPSGQHPDNTQPTRQTDSTVQDKTYTTGTEIIAFLNLETKKSYKTDSKKTRSLINARLKEGFNILDFKHVIKFKNKQWKYDEKMKPYIRPETLFSGNFESYLNEVPQKKEPAKGVKTPTQVNVSINEKPYQEATDEEKSAFKQNFIKQVEGK